jgi:tRNA (cmo5U34)-methyltransferase
MTNAASELFDAQASGYEPQRRLLIPCYDAFYGTAVDALGLCASPPRRILDLGAGTGLLARRVGHAYPDAELVLLDGAPAMLEEARAILGDAARYVVGDFADDLPDGPWDAVVSALAIHHLHDEDKRRLFARVHGALTPGGVFANAEQVAGPSAWLDAYFVRWHEQRSKALGLSDEQWRATLDRMKVDRCATVEAQLTWLRAAGFGDAAALFADHRFAVLAARKRDGGRS